VLQEDLKSEIDRAAALEELDRLVEVDVAARRQDNRTLAVVSGPLERIVPPVLDSVDLGLVQEFEFSRTH
jgi:hypothetical protein